MNTFILSGSHQQDGQSHKVAHYLSDRIKARNSGADTYILNLVDTPLPMWDTGLWSGEDKWQQAWAPHSEKLKAADSFIVVSPEYSGMVPANVKNFFLCVGNNELAHKPGLIVGVSASRGGSYPVAELRMSSYKNTRLCYIPDHVIVQGVGNVLNEDEPENDNDTHIRGRIEHSLKALEAYSAALNTMREKYTLLSDDFPYGM